jgi:hypothetical protein
MSNGGLVMSRILMTAGCRLVTRAPTGAACTVADGRRLSPDAVWDESTRPTGPAPGGRRPADRRAAVPPRARRAGLVEPLSRLGYS